MEQVYICHKCSGLLTHWNEDGDPGRWDDLYPCGCISGYIRDDYQPVAIGDVRALQLQATKDSISLYRAQGRSPNDDIVKRARARFNRLSLINLNFNK